MTYQLVLHVCSSEITRNNRYRGGTVAARCPGVSMIIRGEHPVIRCHQYNMQHHAAPGLGRRGQSQCPSRCLQAVLTTQTHEDSERPHDS